MRLITFFLIFTFSVLYSQHLGPFVKQKQTRLLKANRQETLHLLVSGDENLLENLKSKGITVQTSLGNMATVMVETSELDVLLSVNGIKRITMGAKKRPLNSKTVIYQNVDKAYAKGYTGKNVIAGIVDTGIDFYHPMFLKGDGKTRILSIWDQTATSGTNPDGYNYGAEYTETMINQDIASGSPHSVVPQKDDQGHGTHVAGTFAGRDLTISPDDTLHGGAEDANLIIVKTTFESASIIDGIQYIFNKAAAANKPCVVNLSLGSQFGPHDGSDDDAQAIDALTGPGKIVMQAMGNEGNDAVHYFADDVVNSDNIVFDYSDIMSLWLEKGDGLGSVSLSWDHGSISNVTLGTSKESSDGKITLYYYRPEWNNNGKIACYVVVDDSSGISGDTFTLTLNNLSDANDSGTIERHAWAEGDVFDNPYAPFSQGTLYHFSNYPYTLVNEACGDKVISVGAFISRYSWMSSVGGPYSYTSGGEDGGIAPFSGIGPTAAGGQKPDIIAGGTNILSARSKDMPAPQNELLPPAPYTDNYVYMQGTSMATPAASGAVALLLEKNSEWGPNELRAYLSTHAQGTSRPSGITPDQLKVKDNPNTWDRVFGYGAVDLTYAFDEANALNEESFKIVKTYRLDQNYPNPFNPSTVISYQIPSAGEIELTVFDVLGKRVKTLVKGFQSAGVHKVTFDAAGFSNGIYFYKLISGDYVQVRKMILMK